MRSRGEGWERWESRSGRLRRVEGMVLKSLRREAAASHHYAARQGSSWRERRRNGRVEVDGVASPHARRRVRRPLVEATVALRERSLLPLVCLILMLCGWRKRMRGEGCARICRKRGRLGRGGRRRGIQVGVWTRPLAA